MPIAPDTLLVGTMPNQPYLNDPITINKASAAHSFDSFFAPSISKNTLTQNATLGSERGALTSEKVHELGKSAWKNIGKES